MYHNSEYKEIRVKYSLPGLIKHMSNVGYEFCGWSDQEGQIAKFKQYPEGSMGYKELLDEEGQEARRECANAICAEHFDKLIGHYDRLRLTKMRNTLFGSIMTVLERDYDIT